MKLILSPILLTTGLALSALANANNITLCDMTGCRNGGSTTTTSNYAQTKYPIVLAHGMSGFSKIGSLDYWYGIPQDLAANGSTVFVTQVAAFNSSEVRGEQFLNQVQEILAITGAQKVNLIGHSHGTQSIRYVAGLMPTRVASATSVGGPNAGSPVADLISGVTTIPGLGPIAASTLSSIVNGFGALIGMGSGQAYSQDSLAGLASLTTKGAAAFTAKFPAGMPTAANPCGAGAAIANGVRYYSWGGTSVLTNVLDPIDYSLLLTQAAFGGGANDGLVPRCSNHLGTIIRDNYNMNHLDEVNQVFGLVNIFETNPVSVFRQQANRLKVAGL
jgi:triacylglycerol lipase